MADLLTPSSVTMTTINAAAEKPEKAGGSDKVPQPKPERPDEEKYKEALAKAEKEHAIAQDKFNAMKAKIDNAQPQNKDSAVGKRQQEIKSELQSIRQKQSIYKNSRASTLEKISGLDAQLKTRAADLKTARARIPFKNVAELDQEIRRLTAQVDTGTMKIVDEKKTLELAAAYQAKRKHFAGFDEAQRGIEELKAQIAELRKTLDNPETKALSQKYDELNKELSVMKDEQDKAYGNLNALRKERTALNQDQQAKYTAMKELKDNHFKAKAAFRDYELEQTRIRQERAKSERDAQQKEKRRKIAEQKLEEASKLAYVDEILAADGLIRYFEPAAVESSKSLRGPSGLAAEAQRSVDNSDFKGTKVCKKEDREDNYFTGNGGKKGKKAKTSTPTEGKYNLSIGIIESLAKVDIEAPASQADVPAVVEKIKQKRDQWKKDQVSKTNENIERAQKEIDRLEMEANEPKNGKSNANSK